ncbi:DUF3491 domain-containing protein (plasmid) [Escherichia coli]
MVDNISDSNNENIMTDAFPSLDEYLNADSVLLPDVISRRKKRASGDEEEAGETSESSRPAKRPRTEHVVFDITKWSETDIQILQDIEPELMSSAMHLKKQIEEDYHSVTQEYLSYIDTKLNTLFGQVTDDIAKEQVYSLINELHSVIHNLPESILHISALPERTPVKIHTLQETSFKASLKPSGWSDYDWVLIKKNYPSLIGKIQNLRYDIRHNNKITQERLSGIDKALHILFHSLHGSESRSEVYLLLNEIKNHIPLMNNPVLQMMPLPGAEMMSEHIPDIYVLNISEWDENEKSLAETRFPGIKNETEKLRRMSGTVSQTEKADVVSFYLNLSQLWEVLKTDMARSDVFTVLLQLRDWFTPDVISEFNVPPLPDYIPRRAVPSVADAVFTASLRPSKWTKEERQAVSRIYPGITDSIYKLKRDITGHINVSQERLSDIEKKLRLLWDQLTSEQAKREVHLLLKELKDNLPYTGNRHLHMDSPPEYTPSSEAPYRPAMVFTFTLHPSKWLPEEIIAANKLFPADIAKTLNQLKRDISNYKGVTDERLFTTESKLHELWKHLKGDRAIKEFRDMYRELKYNVALLTNNQFVFRDLIRQEPGTWLMTDFTQRDIGMTDTWLPEDKNIQSTKAPSLMHDLMSLASRESVPVEDIEKMHDVLTQMQNEFYGANARATVQSILDSMQQYFINKKISIQRNVNIFSPHTAETVYSQPLNVIKSMADSVTVWVDSYRLKDTHVKNIISKIIRLRFIDDKISEIRTKEGPSSASRDNRYIALLTQYRDLMSKTSPSLQERGQLLQKIRNEPDLSRFIRNVEASLPLHTNKLLNEKKAEWGKLHLPEQQSAFQQYVEKYKLPEISHLTREFLRRHGESRVITGIPENVQVREISDVLKESSLYHRMNSFHYTFEDRDTIVRLLMASEGAQGLFTSEYIPPLSDEVVSLLIQHLGEDYTKNAAIRDVLIKAAESRLVSPEKPFDIDAPDIISVEHMENFQSLTLLLSLLPVEKWFRNPEWFVPQLSSGLRFSTDGTSLTDKAIMTEASNQLTKDKSFLSYLDMLFEIHQEAIDGHLTDSSVMRRLELTGLTGHIPEERINNLVQKLKSNPWKSLTQIHTLLRQSESLAHGLLLWSSERHPVLKCLLPCTHDRRISSVLLLDEETEGFRQYTEKSHETPRPEQTKYTLLSWDEFYGDHARLWYETAKDFRTLNTEFHPQSLLLSNEGRCMGLALLYMDADYTMVKKNLMTASALFQTRERDGLPLTPQDNNFLTQNIQLIEKLQALGNTFIDRNKNNKRFSWSEDNLHFLLSKSDRDGVILTTPAHSLLIQHLNDAFRVTDPNFGHADFSSLKDVISFTEASLRLTKKISSYYGLSDRKIRKSIFLYDMSEFHSSHSMDLQKIYSSIYQTSQQKIERRSEKIFFAGHEVSWKYLYDIGMFTDGVRVNEITTVGDLIKSSIHGDILRNYVSRTVLSRQDADKLKAVIHASGSTYGSVPVSPDSIYAVPDALSSTAFRVKQFSSQTIRRLSVILDSVSERFRKLGITSSDSLSVNSVKLSDADKGIFSIQITHNDITHELHLEAPEIVINFRKISKMLEDIPSSGIFDFELGLSVAGIIQYSRLLEQESRGTVLQHLNAVMDIKQLAESTLGSMIQVAGNKLFNVNGIEAFRMETWLANQLREAASHSGTALTQVLNSCARLLELPVLETITGAWNLYNSISELQQAKRHTEIISSRVMVAFDTISLSLTLASVVFPPLIVAAGPVAAIGMGAVSIARNVASKEERYFQWEKCRQFLNDGGKNILVANPENNLLDFSGNNVMGNMYLDLREHPPVLKGAPSFNSDRNIGNNPDLNDWQIRSRIGYGYNFIPTSSLAKGYANSQWPGVIPVIPDGEYQTIILGYGKQFRANTDIEYLSNWVVWREVVDDPSSVYARPPLEVLNQQCTVICGKYKTTILPVRVLSDLSDERIEFSRELKDYTFILNGGEGGMMVQPGGAGIYKINADRTAYENTISFRGLPDDFELTFDLSQEQQIISVNSGGKNIPLMTIYQTGLNVVVGTMSARNILKGNEDNNTFHVGYGGGEIHAGGGNNKFIIPGNLKSELILYINTESGRNEIILPETLLSQIRPAGTSLLLSHGENIMIRSTQRKSGLYPGGILHIYTKDGFTLTHTDKNKQSSLLVSFCDTYLWRICNPGKNSDPVNILSLLDRMGWELNDEVIFRTEAMLAIYTRKDGYIHWQPDMDNAEITINGYRSHKISILGTSGCKYNLRSDDASSYIKAELYGDNNHPETIYLQEYLPKEVIAEKYNEGIRIHLSNTGGKHIVDIHHFSVSSGAEIYFSPKDKMTIKDIASLISPIDKSVLLYKSADAIYADRIFRISDNENISIYLPATGRNKENVLCLENNERTEKHVSLNLVSGELLSTVNPQKNISNFKIPAYSRECIIFSGEHNITLTGKVTKTPLLITCSGFLSVPEKRWQSFDNIIVKPKESAPSLYLVDFNRYNPPTRNGEPSELNHDSHLIRIEKRDLIFLLYYLHPNHGICKMKVTLKNYFNDNPEKLTIYDELSSLYNPYISLVSEKYNNFIIILGKDQLNVNNLISLDFYQRFRMNILRRQNNKT